MAGHDLLLILDFGSQYTQLIARRVREERVYCEIHPYDILLEKIQALKPKGVILSGGPASVYKEEGPTYSLDLLKLGIPILGICYGMELIAHLEGVRVRKAGRREYGKAILKVASAKGIFEGFQVGEELICWMSHGDYVDSLPRGYILLGSTPNAPIAAFGDPQRKIYGVMFHPEVAHTPRGEEVIANFLFGVCGCRPTWTAGSFIEGTVKRVRREVEKARVISALSGGVDSSVATALVHQAVGDQLTPIFVDTGLLRKGEREMVEKTFRQHLHIDLRVVDGRDLFLSRLRGVVDPEAKRTIIGHTFIEVFEREAAALPGVEYLVQGTLYPDVIESASVRGPSVTIKTHHNVGGLPQKMHLRLIEPLRELFKDEVRLVGRELGLPEEVVGRHPFPGPGLAVRVLGEVTPERLERVRQTDEIYLEEIKRWGLYQDIWQAFAVLLPVQSVGVMGDGRTYENVIALRAVTSRDGMTADWYPFPHDFLAAVSNRIINEVPGVNRVVYDVSSKPPSTIEWE